MYGPGEYVPDVTEGITRVEDLPKPKIRKHSRNYKKCKCPFCGHLSYRDNTFTRKLQATFNPVERANRRHRKMQKSIYRVRSKDHISQRITIDMLRDSYACGPNETVNTLHHTRKRALLCR